LALHKASLFFVFVPTLNACLLFLVTRLARFTFTRKMGFNGLNLDFKQQLLTGHQHCK